MNRNILRTAFVVSAIALGACKGGKSEPKLETKPIASSGFVVDVPSGWTIKTDMENYYTLAEAGGKGLSIRVTVTDGGTMPGSLDELVSHASCEDASKAVKQTLPSGGMFVQCDVKAAKVNDKVVMAPQVDVEVPGAKKLAECRYTTDQDIETVAAVCKSLRKA